MKQCPKCGIKYENDLERCPQCNCYLMSVYKDRNSYENEKQTKIHDYRILMAMIVLIVIIVAIAMISNQKSQYELDYESMQNKTYNEMSNGEQQVFRDELEWEIENAD